MSMTHRERAMAILNYRDYDRMPVVHFGYWGDCYAKWAKEGYLTAEDMRSSDIERITASKQGFDFGWYASIGGSYGLSPVFNQEVLETYPDGTRKLRQNDGVIVINHPEYTSIPQEVDHTLKDRASWEEHYLPRLRFSMERVNDAATRKHYARAVERGEPIGISCGSVIGTIRNWVGVTELSYLMVDDPGLLEEMIHTYADLAFECTRRTLEAVDGPVDFGHFWEDICFKSGPLVVPSMFAESCGWAYRRVTELLKSRGTTIASLDCDGMIDALIPTWLENGVNTMFPIEVGTWNASIGPWREKYGRQIRGIGGMDKNLFALDRAAIDAEIERLKPLVELGGFIPCPDHRIPPDAKWELIQYYCDRVRKVLSPR